MDSEKLREPLCVAVTMPAVRAKLRSSIKRLLVKHGYPPDRQPVAIKLVMEQMESMAPRYSEERAA